PTSDRQEVILRRVMASAAFPALDFAFLENVEIPQVCRVRLTHPRGNPIADVEGAVRQAVRSSRRLQALPAGSEVAIALGSRGISRIVVIGRALVSELKALGHRPFIVPAMGRHGGATAEGQVEVLAKLGLTEEALGAPIRSSMEVVDYGVTPDGARCKF